jgi:hypothetical protein
LPEKSSQICKPIKNRPTTHSREIVTRSIPFLGRRRQSLVDIIVLLYDLHGCSGRTLKTIFLESVHESTHRANIIRRDVMLQTARIIEEESPHSLEKSRDCGPSIDGPRKRLTREDKDSRLEGLIKDLSQSWQEEGENLLPVVR